MTNVKNKRETALTGTKPSLALFLMTSAQLSAEIFAVRQWTMTLLSFLSLNLQFF